MMATILLYINGHWLSLEVSDSCATVPSKRLEPKTYYNDYISE